MDHKAVNVIAPDLAAEVSKHLVLPIALRTLLANEHGREGSSSGVSVYKFRVLAAFDALVQMVLRATVWLKEPRAPDRRACDRCCDADLRAQQKKENAKGEIEVSRTWGTLIEMLCQRHRGTL